MYPKLSKFVVARKCLNERMDSRSVDSRKLILMHNPNRSCILAVVQLGDRIQRTDYQTSLVDIHKRLDDYVLRNKLVVHMCQLHRLVDIRDLVDRMLRDLYSLRCIDSGRERMKSMDCLEYQVDKCNWRDDFVPNTRHHVHIASFRTSMD